MCSQIEDWNVIYRLRDDAEQIADVQHATINTKEFGLVPEHAVFGTKEWWDAVEDSRIPLYIQTGLVTDVFVSGESEWPQIEVTAGNELHIWTCMGGVEKYHLGDVVRIEYVLQKPKRSWTGSPHHKIVISVAIKQKH